MGLVQLTGRRASLPKNWMLGKRICIGHKGPEGWRAEVEVQGTCSGLRPVGRKPRDSLKPAIKASYRYRGGREKEELFSLKKKKKIHTKIDQFAIQFLSQRLHLPFPWRQRVRSGRAGLGPPPQPIFQMRCTKAPGRLGLVQRVQKGEGTKHGSRLQWAPPCLCPACLPTGSGPGHCRAD